LTAFNDTKAEAAWKGNSGTAFSIPISVGHSAPNFDNRENFMIGTQRSWRTDAGIRPGSALHRLDSPEMTASLPGRRSAIAMSEPEDAQLTGMTRSLDRRLLALNLKPAASASSKPVAALKVA
jgi:hypothetical protein